jgi:two-component system phosphate regulon sensor histidine kinase PhoR
MNAATDLNAIASLFESERDGLLFEWRKQLREVPSARHLDVPTLNDHMPVLLDVLVAALRAKSDSTIPDALAEVAAPAHGLQRVGDGFDIEEVVAEYNILRACIHDLADARRVSLQGKPFRILNRVFDHAIGLALQTYATQRALDVQLRREEYLAFVAHDLRTPLAAISMAGRVLELTQTAPNAAAEIARMLKALRRNVQHLEKLVGKVLEENANLQTEIGIKLERREFDLWPFVEALVHDLHPVAGTSSTRIRNEVPDDLVVYADASLLRRVLQNLIANAIRYTPRGEIRIEALDLGASAGVECRVVDSGAGIPAELLARIFEKGETGPEHDDGMGLGLAIVKTFVEAGGGEVGAQSAEGMGSVFRFTLPARTA